MLYKRIVEQGTLSEPKGAPDPEFALPGTTNWMRAVSVLLEKQGLDFQSAKLFFSSVQRRTFTAHEENTVLEQLLFALHQVSALEALRTVARKTDVGRVGIVAWYYGIYAAASAMIAAQDGSIQDDHAGTANSWDRHFVVRGLAMPPFDLRISTLVEKKMKAEIEHLRQGSSFDLKHAPLNASDAHGAMCAYLSGNAIYYRWRAENDIRRSKEFKALNVENFRTKAAQQLRDQRLEGKSVSFLHQAFRYRGKANYREALYLGYGRNLEGQISSFVDDLAFVLTGFVIMAGAFAAKRLDPQVWSEFLDDLEKNRSFTVSPKAHWS